LPLFANINLHKSGPPIFTSAVLSDIIYGKSELANEYLIGQFIGQIFSISMSLAVVLSLLGILFKITFKDLFEQILNYPRMQSDLKNIRKVKKGRKAK